MKHHPLGLGLLFGATLLLASPAMFLAEETTDLDFEARVRAQRAIESVQHGHRIGTKSDFETVATREVLEAKVNRFLRQSHALAGHWKTSVTAYKLDRELERMLRDSRDPDRLWELFAALDNDPVLIRECLARPILVDRLTRNFFAFDREIHAEARLEAERLHDALKAGELDTIDAHPRRIVRELSVRDAGDGSGLPESPEDLFKTVDAKSFAEWRASMPPLDEVGSVIEGAGSFGIRVLLEEEPGHAKAAVYVVPKRDPDEWWSKYEPLPVRTVADLDAALPSRETAGGTTLDGWRPLPHSPLPRTYHQAVWTGSEMIVWGGTERYQAAPHPLSTRSGSLYDPATDTWAEMSTVDAPDPREYFTAVWTGSELIVWGGRDDSYDLLGTGSRYDPVSASWAAVATSGAPSARADHIAIWTGSEMIVWGGWGGGATGGRYDPSTDQWLPTTNLGAPEARAEHTAVWTGSEMIVWGGYDLELGYLGTGGRYDPSSNSWSSTRTDDAPDPRWRHTAVWTGSAMIVWGGEDADHYLATGGRYNPALDRWSSVNTVDGPTARRYHTAVWSGSEMIVWGGHAVEPNTGARYDPSSDSWTPVQTGGAPFERRHHTAVWSGDEMIVWGGDPLAAGGPTDSGGRYDPDLDAWTPTSRSSLWHEELYGQTGVWTGSELLLYGGTTGDVYDYGHKFWIYVPATGSLSSRDTGIVHLLGHTAVWSGNYMLLWGGYNLFPYPTRETASRGGSRYDPVADVWSFMASTNAPAGRRWHSAVWTGQEMVIWGGYTSSTATYLDDGGRYDPVANVWFGLQNSYGLIPGRSGHSAVWTGDAMIVWGGYNGEYLTSGGRYDFSSHSWSTIQTAGAPQGRTLHSTVWTGDEMIVWGGSDGEKMNTGGRYDPVDDTWSATSTDGAPASRSRHGAVWMGVRMIVWGGASDRELVSDGAEYSPESDSWAPLDPEHAPLPRHWHVVLPMNNDMTVWGGLVSNYTAEYVQPGFYRLNDADDDGFAFTEDCDDFNPNCNTDCTDADIDSFCVTHDCDETSPDTYPGASEINDGLDNQCPGFDGHGLIDEISGVCGFDNSVDVNELSWSTQTGATSYEVARSTDPRFAADCFVHTTTATYWDDGTPVPVDTCLHYLVRSTQPNVGSWGASSEGEERAPVCP